jgi:hypothetical protein
MKFYVDNLNKIDEMIDQAEESIKYAKSIGVKSYPYDLGYLDCLKELKRWIDEQEPS